jgi:hypothetical protein
MFDYSLIGLSPIWDYTFSGHVASVHALNCYVSGIAEHEPSNVVQHLAISEPRQALQ